MPVTSVLEDGADASAGTGLRRPPGRALGEAVFATGMTGYQETLTDPSYHRQIVVQTAPQIGNTGWNDEDDESARIQVAGLRRARPGADAVELAVPAVAGRRAARRRASSAWRGSTPARWSGTCASAGAMRAGVFSGPMRWPPTRSWSRGCAASPRMEGADLYGEVTTREPYVVAAAGEPRFRVAALDLGIKANTPRMLAARGIETHVLPADTPIEEIEALGPDGFFLSNGPGDPATADRPVALTRQVLERRIPLFGICFGNQILGRALGRGTYKLRFGHRGINIPVVEHAHRPGGDHLAEPRVRRRGRGGGAVRHPVRPGRDHPHLPERRLRRGPGCSTSRRSACSTTRRPRPARTTPPTCSTGSST